MTSAATGWKSLLPGLHDAQPDPTRAARTSPDQRDGAVYVTDQDLLLAVDVALAARRPLLLRGAPGSGKSSLAAFLARNLGWRYYEQVVTARTRPRDLLWTFDAVRKLADASAAGTSADSLQDTDYVEPGILWWAMDPDSARRRGVPVGQEPPHRPAAEPDADVNGDRDRQRAVVLVDEIDKADPDLPNGLLVPLGSSEFRVEETGLLVHRKLAESTESASRGSLLVIVTTNEERELPPAFLRRCVTYLLPAPNEDRLVEIGRRHLVAAGHPPTGDDDHLLTQLARRLETLQENTIRQGRRPPSTAEFLDALFACRALDVSTDAEVWPRLEQLVLRKDSAGAGES